MKRTNEDAPRTASLQHALLDAQQGLESVGKDSTNSFHKYRYTSSEQMIGACRAALHRAGLSLHRDGWQLSQDGQTVTSTFVLAHPSSSEKLSYSIPWIVVVEKGRPIDKALAGALTTSLGYFLRDLLLLPREDEDASMDRRDDTKAQAGFKRQERPSAVSELNQRIAPAPKAEQPKAPQAKETDLTARVARVFTKTVGGADYTMVTIDADAGRFDAVVARSAGDVSGLQGKECSMRVSMPEGRTPQLLNAHAKEADDEGLGF